MTVTIEEIIEQTPTGLLWLTIQDEAGDIKISGVPIQRLVETNYKTTPPSVQLIWDEGSEYAVNWQVDSIEQEGPQTRLIGPQGVAIVSRRSPMEETN